MAWGRGGWRGWLAGSAAVMHCSSSAGGGRLRLHPALRCIFTSEAGAPGRRPQDLLKPRSLGLQPLQNVAAAAARMPWAYRIPEPTSRWVRQAAVRREAPLQTHARPLLTGCPPLRPLQGLKAKDAKFACKDRAALLSALYQAVALAAARGTSGLGSTVLGCVGVFVGKQAGVFLYHSASVQGQQARRPAG